MYNNVLFSNFCRCDSFVNIMVNNKNIYDSKLNYETKFNKIILIATYNLHIISYEKIRHLNYRYDITCSGNVHHNLSQSY